jgi:hypothetical protein
MSVFWIAARLVTKPALAFWAVALIWLFWRILQSCAIMP